MSSVPSVIQSEKIKSLREKFEKDANNRIMQNILTKNRLNDLAINRSIDQVSRRLFSVTTEPRVKITNQKSSGRCWEFAAFNLLRREVIKKFNLKEDFELSQSHFFFWDKFERFNYNLERIIETSSSPLDDRAVQCILSDPICDGGQWDMFVNIVKRHGVVPKSVYGESQHSSNSGELNSILKRRFREYSLAIRTILKNGHENASLKAAREKRDEALEEVFSLLCRLFGTPPETFTWEYTDSRHKYGCIRDLTPISFLNRHININLDDYVCLVNDPRNVYFEKYTVQYLGNVEGGEKVLYLNVPISEMKQCVKNSLQNGEVVWFGCDVGKSLSGTVMDDKLVEIGGLLGLDFSMTKEERLQTGESLMTHAMVFSGCNIDEQGLVNRYEVENSWGSKNGEDGYYLMSDTWFSQYVYEIAINKRFLPKSLLSALEKQEIHVLPIWDPMGSLAQA